MKERTGTVYILFNSRTGEVYVGSTKTTLEARMASHRWEAYSNNDTSPIHTAMRGSSVEDWVIEAVRTDIPAHDLSHEEMECIREYKSRGQCLNIYDTVGTNVHGVAKSNRLSQRTTWKWSKESRERMKKQYVDGTRTNKTARGVRVVETGVEFPSIGACADALGVTRENLSYAINKQPAGYVHKADVHIEALGGTFTIHSTNNRPVRCVESGAEYESISEASREEDLNVGSIARACKCGGRAGGLHWEFIDA